MSNSRSAAITTNGSGPFASPSSTAPMRGERTASSTPARISSPPTALGGLPFRGYQRRHDFLRRGATSYPEDGAFRWACWEPDRLAGIEAKGEGRVTLIERPCSGHELLLNFRTAPDGWIKAEIVQTIHTPPQPVEAHPGVFARRGRTPHGRFHFRGRALARPNRLIGPRRRKSRPPLSPVQSQAVFGIYLRRPAKTSANRSSEMPPKRCAMRSHVKHSICKEMNVKNITVSVDEETHRLARIRAAELGISVSALVRGFLKTLVCKRVDKTAASRRLGFMARTAQSPRRLRQYGRARDREDVRGKRLILFADRASTSRKRYAAYRQGGLLSRPHPSGLMDRRNSTHP